MADLPAGRHPRVAVIGGSGFYEFLDDPTDGRGRPRRTATRRPRSRSATSAVGRSRSCRGTGGATSSRPTGSTTGRTSGRCASLGVPQILAPCAVGGLQPETQPATLVVPDQLVDRTTSRVQTYVDTGAAHAPFADPYCPDLRAALVGAAGDVIDGGTMVVIEGPRFSTRAESQSYARPGWTVVNMTGHPEAVLARELGLCYATIALVTDLDAGVSQEESVDQAQVFALFEKHIGRLKELLGQVVAGLPSLDGEGQTRPCGCADWLADVTLPFELPGPTS